MNNSENEQFTITVMKTVGFTDEHIERIKREQVFQEDTHRRNLMRLKKELGNTEKMEKDCVKLGIIIEQEFYKLMKRAGLSDEEIDQNMAAVHHGRRDRGDLQADRTSEDRAEV